MPPFHGPEQAPNEWGGKMPAVPPFRSIVRGGTVLTRPVWVNVESL
jgi:hypothetical protein